MGLVNSRQASETWIIEFNSQLKQPLQSAVDFFKEFFGIKDENQRLIWIKVQQKYQYPFFVALVLLLKPLEDHLKTLDKLNYDLLQRYQKSSLPFLENHQIHLLQFVPPNTPRMVKHMIYTQSEHYQTEEEKKSNAKLREILLKTPNLSMYFRIEYIFQEYKTLMVRQLRGYWKYELEKFKEFNELKTPNGKLGVEGLRWCHDVNNIGYTPFGFRFTEDQFEVFKLHEPLLDTQIVTAYREAYTTYQARKNLYKLTEEQKEKKVSAKKIKNDPQLQPTQNFPSTILIPFFQEFKDIPDEQASAWLKKQSESKDYCYPFYHSQSVLNYLVDAKKNMYSEDQLAHLEKQFTEAVIRLKKLGLANYLDEMNEAFLIDLEDGIMIFFAGLERSRLPPQF